MQATLKRLLEAEDQAQEILKAAEERARKMITQAREQATQSIEVAHRDAAAMLRSGLEGAQSKAAIDVKQRMDRAEAEAREIEGRANEHFSDAVDMVVDWVISGSASGSE
jgi:vacuolar-type H+-ATPase subunit H